MALPAPARLRHDPAAEDAARRRGIELIGEENLVKKEGGDQ